MADSGGAARRPLRRSGTAAAARRWRHRPPRWAAAVGLAAVAVAAAGVGAAVANAPPASTPTTLPFPRAAGRSAAEGALPALCSLQCTVLGGSPPPTVTVNGTAVRVSPSACADYVDLVGVTRGNTPAIDLYRSPLPREAVAKAVRRAGSPVGGTVTSAAVWYAPFLVGAPPLPCGASRVRGGGDVEDGAPTVGILGGSYRGAAGEAQRLYGEADIVRALTLRRNSVGGNVYRLANRFAVTALTSRTLGVCADRDCQQQVAVDMTRRRRYELDVAACTAAAAAPAGTAVPPCVISSVPALTYVGTDGVERPVSMKDDALLSLGRGLLAQSGWLGPAAPSWGLEARVNLFGVEPTGKFPHFEWNLNGSGVRAAGVGEVPPWGPPSATPFFSFLATAFCSDGATFVVDHSVCEGVYLERSEGPTGPGRRRVIPAMSWDVESQDVDVGSAPLRQHQRPMWTAGEERGPLAHTGPLPDALRGRGRRELNAASADEAALAAALFTRSLPLPAPVRTRISPTLELREGATVLSWVDDEELAGDLLSMSTTYRGDAFEGDPPGEPVTTAAVLLGITVVVPEVLALAAIGTRRSPWERRTWVTYAVLVAVGLSSLGSLIALAVAERAGAAWRTATIREGLVVNAPPAELVSGLFLDLTGALVVREESLILLARPGYRPRLVVGTAAGMGAVLLATSIVVAAIGARSSWRKRQRQVVDDAEAPPADGV